MKTPPAGAEGAGLISWAGKIPWRRKWKPTSVFVPGKSHGQRSLVAAVYGVQRVGHGLPTEQDIKWRNTLQATPKDAQRIHIECHGRRAKITDARKAPVNKRFSHLLENGHRYQ